MRALAPIACLCAALMGCAGDPTEIVLVVDTDRVDATGFTVDATYPSGGEGRSTADLADRPAPRRLVLVHEGGPLGPVRLRVTATGAAGPLATVEREVTFERGESLTLRVFIRASCGACPAGLTCGDEGECRAAAVASCEYEGRTCSMDGGAPPGEDAGARDAATEDGGAGDAGRPFDGGGCPALCGVGGTYLPGDLASPAPCVPASGFTLSVLDPSGAPVTPTGDPPAYRLTRPGSFEATLMDPVGRCETVEESLEVSLPDGPATPHPATGTLRDLDARVGTGFVASQSGAYAADLAGWYDLRAPAVATGDVAVLDQSSVAVADGIPYFGPNADRDEITRVEAVSPFDAAVHRSIDIGGGDRTIYDLAARQDASGPVALASGRVSVVQSPASTPVARDLGSDYAPTGWIAMGTLEHPSVGAIWAGRTDEIVNRPLGSGGAFGDGDVLSRPGGLGDLVAAGVDDTGGEIDLWLCGTAGVQRVRLPDRDWGDAESLPAASASAAVPCADLSIGADGSVWVAAGSLGLVRLAADGSRVGAVAPGEGLPAGTSVDLVATASDPAAREVWFLDTSSRRLFVLQADPTP